MGCISCSKTAFLLVFSVNFLLQVDAQEKELNVTIPIGVLDLNNTVCRDVENTTFAVTKETVDVKITYTAKFEDIDSDGNGKTPINYTEVLSNYTAVLLTFSYDIAAASFHLGIPYLLTSESSDIVSPPNMFWIDQLYLDFAQAALSLLTAVKRTRYLTVIKSADFENFNVFALQFQRLLIPTYFIEYGEEMNETVFQQELNKAHAPYADTSTFVVLLPDYLSDRLPWILTIALQEGHMNIDQLWLIPSLHAEMSHLESFRRTHTRIVTFGLGKKESEEIPRSTNDTSVRALLCNDAISHLVKTVAAFSSQTNLTTRLSERRFPESVGSFGYKNRIRTVKTLYYLRPCPEGDAKSDEDLFCEVGSWDSKTSIATIKDPTISKAGIVVRLGVVQRKPFFYESFGSYNGLFHQLFTAIASKQNWELKWKVYENFGERDNATNTYDGMLGGVVNGDIDIAVDYMRANEERLKDMDFSTPIFEFGYITLARSMEKGIYWLLFIYPFGIWVWIALGIIFIFESLVLFLVDRLTPSHMRNGVRKPYNFGDSFFNIFISFTITKEPIRPLTFSARCFMTVVWFGTLIIVASFTANLTAFLYKSEAHPPSHLFFTSLVKNMGRMRWFFNNGTEVIAAMRNSNDSVEMALVSKAEKNWPNMMYQNSSMALSFLRKHPHWVYVADEIYATYVANMDCDLRSGKQTISRTPGRVAFRKNFPLAKQVNDSLDELRLSKGIEGLQRTWIDSARPCAVSPVLTLLDVSPLFILLAGGVALAFLVALFESLCKACAIFCMRLKIPKLSFGKVYDGKIVEVQQDGVLVSVNERPNRYFLHNSQLHQHPIKNVDAESLGLHEGSHLKVRYFGKDPVSKAKRFIRETEM